MPPEIRVGTSGYQYKHWKGDFYPKELPVKKWFEHYLQFFDTVEINNTFYRMPNEATFETWKEAAPKNFCYAIKYSRYGTHLKKLKDPKDHVDYFLERVYPLKSLLGPILGQLPPNWKRNINRLEEFLRVLPADLRWAVEFRDTDWLHEETYEVLRRFNISLVIHDMIPDHPRIITSNWNYMRYHGHNYSGSYTDAELNSIADGI
ncbi:MAG TPA: DUF72 domain-containing protein, partial [Salinimicrobium sp.]|nr:DUF72 domain-containing protein [Salinimicrobium sp.]